MSDVRCQVSGVRWHLVKCREGGEVVGAGGEGDGSPPRGQARGARYLHRKLPCKFDPKNTF